MTPTDFAIQVRPTLFARIVFGQFYYWAIPLAMALVLIPESLYIRATRGEFAGRLTPLEGTVLVLVVALVAVWLMRFARRIQLYFIDRSTLLLTPSALFLGRKQVPVLLDEVRDAYFVTQHWFGRRYRPAGRGVFNVLLLMLHDGSVVPVSPPPGQFNDGGIPEVYPATTNVAQFMTTLVALLEGRLRPMQPLPEQALPFLHPFEANRVYDPAVPPPRGVKWALIRSTWL